MYIIEQRKMDENYETKRESSYHIIMYIVESYHLNRGVLEQSTIKPRLWPHFSKAPI